MKPHSTLLNAFFFLFGNLGKVVVQWFSTNMQIIIRNLIFDYYKQDSKLGLISKIKEEKGKSIGFSKTLKK